MARPDQSSDERVLRAERILDTAADLLVAWGYRRVTIDDVARRAGIGKGTVYLHFSSKQVLFLTVLMRSQIRMTEKIIERLRDDPAAVLPGEVARFAYLMVHRDPVARAVLTGDYETLGELSRVALSEAGDLPAERLRVLERYFRILREVGVVRVDSTPELQFHAFSAIMTGFVTIEPIMATDMAHAAAKADMLAHVVRSAFEIGADPEALRTATARMLPVYERLLGRLRAEVATHTLIREQEKT